MQKPQTAESHDLFFATALAALQSDGRGGAQVEVRAMANLYEILAGAQQGKAMFALGREFGLSPQQTQAAVTALLPAISMASSNRRRPRKGWETCSP
jgi:hypothetical protein